MLTSAERAALNYVLGLLEQMASSLNEDTSRYRGIAVVAAAKLREVFPNDVVKIKR